MLAEMRTLIERATNDIVLVEILVEPEAWPVEIDVNQLENAILNLAVNARDAMAGDPNGGTLAIRLGNVAVDAREAARQGVGPGDYVRLSVADSGKGMTEEVRARAFEPFFTTKGVGRGTGLGLSQVHGFVRQSGGFVTIETQAGEGTAVHLWLPRTLDAPILPDMIRERAAEARGNAAHVMVVEDNDTLRELVVETLRDAGYRVIEAHDGRAALSLFARQSPTPDLVLVRRDDAGARRLRAIGRDHGARAGDQDPADERLCRQRRAAARRGRAAAGQAVRARHAARTRQAPARNLAAFRLRGLDAGPPEGAGRRQILSRDACRREHGQASPARMPSRSSRRSARAFPC